MYGRAGRPSTARQSHNQRSMHHDDAVGGQCRRDRGIGPRSNARYRGVRYSPVSSSRSWCRSCSPCSAGRSGSPSSIRPSRKPRRRSRASSPSSGGRCPASLRPGPAVSPPAVSAGGPVRAPPPGTGWWPGPLRRSSFFYLLTTAIGGIVGGAFSLFGNVAGAAAGAIAAVAPAVTEAVDPFSGVETNLNDAIGVNDPAAGRARRSSTWSGRLHRRGSRRRWSGDGPCRRRLCPRDPDDAGRGPGAAHDVEVKSTTRRSPRPRPRPSRRPTPPARRLPRPVSSASSRSSSVRWPAGIGGLNSPLPSARDSFVGAGFGRRRDTVVR